MLCFDQVPVTPFHLLRAKSAAHFELHASTRFSEALDSDAQTHDVGDRAFSDGFDVCLGAHRKLPGRNTRHDYKGSNKFLAGHA